jgi:hypothetical protein
MRPWLRPTLQPNAKLRDLRSIDTGDDGRAWIPSPTAQALETAGTV